MRLLQVEPLAAYWAEALAGPPAYVAQNQKLRGALHAYFAWATTTPMARYHGSADDVPDGLQIRAVPGEGWSQATEAPRSLYGMQATCT